MRQRFLFDTLVAHLTNRKFTIIVGARQTGKSTLLKQLRDHCNANQYATAWLNMENKQLRNELDKAPENLLQYLPAMPTQEKVYVFIDEIQKLTDPSNFLKLIWDEYTDKIKIIATGSSAFYIDEKFDDSLAGRKKVFSLYTCSFEEYLYLSEADLLLDEFRRVQTNSNAKSLYIPQLQDAFLRYMQYGGYPEVITTHSENEKRDILIDLRDSFIKKDIQNANVRDEDAFYKLMRLLAAQTGCLVNMTELSKMLHLKEETVANYIKVMEKSFHIQLIKPFYRNISKELVKRPMVYFYDSGMRNCLMNNFLPSISNPDMGTVWENQVFRILVDHYGAEDIHFWRTTDGKEVDFVLPMQNPPHAIEVKKSQAQAKLSKYKSFTNTYTDFQFSFYSLEPFNENLIRQLS